MDGAAELRQLAHLLRIGADAVREIATLRPNDTEAIDRLAGQAVTMAGELEAIVAGPRGGATILPFTARLL